MLGAWARFKAAGTKARAAVAPGWLIDFDLVANAWGATKVPSNVTPLLLSSVAGPPAETKDCSRRDRDR